MTVWRDVRYGARLMRRSPGFTLVAVLVLGLGIGVNTALFSVVNALFFSPLPVRAPGELTYIYRVFPNGNAGRFLGAQGDVFAAQGAEFADFASHALLTTNLTWEGETEVTTGEAVDGRYFGLLGVRTALGRPLGPADDNRVAIEPAIVISHRLWMRRFHGDANVLGKMVRVGTPDHPRDLTIVGVADQRFRGLSDAWMPSEFWIAFAEPYSARTPIARLKRGTTLERFRAFVQSTTPSIRELIRGRGLPGPSESLRSGDDIRFVVLRANDVRTPSNPYATLIPANVLAGVTTVIALVLLIATANIAGLLLARGIVRKPEIAMRLALGAGRIHLTQQFLIETMLLSTLGGALGLLVGSNFLAALQVAIPSTFLLDVRFDWRVWLFSGGLCVGTGLLVGLAPAVQAGRVDLLAMLGNVSVDTHRTRTRLRHSIMVPQIALSLVLLVVAGAHVRALARIELSDLGYATDGGIVLRVGRREALGLDIVSQLPHEKRQPALEDEAARARTFARVLLDRVGSVVGVRSTGLTDALPFRSYRTSEVQVTARASGSTAIAPQTRVSDGYFDAIGIRVILGRALDDRDAAAGRRTAVISQTLAQRFWPAGDSVGQAMMLAPVNSRMASSAWFEVVSVVEDVSPILGGTSDQSLVYLPIIEPAAGRSSVPIFWSSQSANLVIRGEGDRSALVNGVKAAISGVGGQVSSVRTTEQIVGEILYPRRVAAVVLSAAGLISLALATIGLYGVVSYSVAQRQREIGIRATLGAQPDDLVRLVVREGTHAIAIGGVTGSLLALAGLRVAARVTSGLPPIDLISLFGVLGMLFSVGLIACYVPARRAARVDPVHVLRAS